MSTPLPPASTAAPADSLITITHVVYGLHTVSLVIGAFGAASIVGMFLFGWPSIIAVVINYVKRDEVRGTYLDSHFSWQIRTFWYAMAAAAITLAITIPFGFLSFLSGFVTFGIGFLGMGVAAVLWFIGFLIIGIWAIYRIARGWLALMDRRPMPLPN
jgi:uncharacterized membrane protein